NFLSRLLLTGTHLYLAVEEWRRRHGAELREWLDAWGEFEALNALGNYAYENSDHTFPEFVVEKTGVSTDTPQRAGLLVFC
ncbi:MAG: mutS domain protein, partial [Candidatus Solibacter sp.]|nr:mutS domain protein [Candidatus Solibacter sp.]